jgi:glycosyltransferase involved in cell wall biosynthesis
MLGDYPRDPQHIGGGVEAITLYLLRGLQQFRDLDLHMITLHSNVPTQTVSHGGITVHYIQPDYRLNALTLDAYHQHLLRRKLYALQPDVTHTHITGTYPLAAAGAGFPMVLTLQGIRWREMTLWRNWRSRLYGRWIVARQERASVRKAEYVIASSPPYIRKEFGPLIRGEIFDIENPVKEDFFHIERRAQPNRILFAGHISVRKAVLELLEAVEWLRARVPDIQVRLAGRTSIDAVYTERVRVFIRNHNLQEHVHLLGSLDEASLLDEYARCAFLVLPSRQETAPMVIGQAMAAGVPVVATRVGGVDYLVKDGHTGFVVEFGDIQGLAAAMSRLLGDASLQVRMGRAGQAEAHRRFRAEVVARQTRAVYDHMLARGA